jgi:CO/xanthine dehydrogenase Mo-binding subunit
MTWTVSAAMARDDMPAEQALIRRGNEVRNGSLTPLGALRSLQDLELRNYSMTTTGTTAVFSFKGTFETDAALVTVTVLKTSGAVRVLAFHLDPIPGRNFPSLPRTQT